MEMLTTRQAAERLNVSIATIGKLIRAGEIHAVKVGHNWRIPADSLTAYLSRPAEPEKPAGASTREGITNDK